MRNLRPKITAAAPASDSASSGRGENVLIYLEIAMKSGFEVRDVILKNPAFAHMMNQPEFQLVMQKYPPAQ